MFSLFIMPNLFTAKAKQLVAYKEKVAQLQEQVDRTRAEALANLHEEYGFADAEELINAIRAAAGKRRGRRPGRPAKKAGDHHKHARITPEIRQKIRTALKAGKTGGAVAEEFGVSLPSVYNIKKEFGLVKARKPAKVKKPAKTKKRATTQKAAPPEAAAAEK